MHNIQLKTLKSAGKSVADQVVELKDTRPLFACLLIVAHSRCEINLKESIGDLEFTSVSRALFSVTGELLPCTDKSKLMHTLEELPTETGDPQPQDVYDTAPLPSGKALLLIEWHLTRQWVSHVGSRHAPSGLTTLQLYSTASVATLDEVPLVSDRYDIATLLKEATRDRRRLARRTS